MRPSVLVTGASSGIGQALAIALAAPGVVLHLSGRDTDRLEAVAEACRAKNATVFPVVLDVRDQSDMAAWIDAAGPLDLVVANAGISAGTFGGMPETPEQVRAIFATNVDGVLNTVLPAIEVMAAQAPGRDGVRGRIAVIASIAAFVPGSRAPAYCASKAAADTWTVASAPAARARGIALTSICPGYIRTPMTEGYRFSMPGVMDADRAARIILRGIAAGRVRVTFPWWMGCLAQIGGLLPARFVSRMTSRQRGEAPKAAHATD